MNDRILTVYKSLFSGSSIQTGQNLPKIHRNAMTRGNLDQKNLNFVTKNLVQKTKYVGGKKKKKLYVITRQFSETECYSFLSSNKYNIERVIC